MGLLPDTENCELRMRRECRERFPHQRRQRKLLVNDPCMHHGTCVTHVPWYLLGSPNRYMCTENVGSSRFTLQHPSHWLILRICTIPPKYKYDNSFAYDKSEGCLYRSPRFFDHSLLSIALIKQMLITSNHGHFTVIWHKAYHLPCSLLKQISSTMSLHIHI